MPDVFQPLPLLGNPHVQTILASVLRGSVPHIASRERLIVLPDGDRLVIQDSFPSSGQSHNIALLLHGLGGHHNSPYVRRVTARLLARDFRVMRLDLRGSGRGEDLARKIYNGACSDDVRVALAAIHRSHPHARIVLIGFSLGGNIALKLAGEASHDPVPGLVGVAAVAPPIDLERCAKLLTNPRNRFYDLHFVQTLTKMVRMQERHFPDMPRTRFPSRLTVREFDEVYTSPRGGFRNALDYYRKASSYPLITEIEIPTFLLTSRDDPFIAVEPFEALPRRKDMAVHILPYGGHLGFLGWDGSGGIRWGERQVVDWARRFHSNASLTAGEACA